MCIEQPHMTIQMGPAGVRGARYYTCFLRNRRFYRFGKSWFKDCTGKTNQRMQRNLNIFQNYFLGEISKTTISIANVLCGGLARSIFVPTLLQSSSTEDGELNTIFPTSLCSLGSRYNLDSTNHRQLGAGGKASIWLVQFYQVKQTAMEPTTVSSDS